MHARVVQTELGVFAEQLHLRGVIARDCADVLPVAGELIGEEVFALSEQRRDDVLAEVLVAFGIGVVGEQRRAQHRPGENVNAHGGEIALRLLRLFGKARDAHVLIDGHDAEAAGLLPRHGLDRNGEIRAHELVEVEHQVIVHLVEMVAGEDDDILGVVAVEKVDVVVNRVGGAFIPFAAGLRGIRRENVHAAPGRVQIPRRARAEIPVEQRRLILDQHADGVNAGVDAVGKGKIDHAVFPAERNGRLGDLLRQNTQTAALAARQEHGYAFFFSHGQVPP